MRQALAGLTLRGRCFFAAGIACCVCAFALGSEDLLRAGLLVTALPVLAALVVARLRYRLACARRLEPARVSAGEVATVRLTMENVSRLPTSVLLVEDTVPYVLGGRPRFVVDRMRPRVPREVTYPLRSDLRGRFRIGPLSIRLADPFGMCELTRSFTAYDNLTVTPIVQALPAVAIGGDWAGGGESASRQVATAGEDDVGTREYRIGDDLRRVHWRSTARYGELMVRREEQPWQSRAAILLDNRLGAHRGDGPASSLEYAVSAAASIGVHLARAGYAMRLVLADGTEIVTPSGVTAGFDEVLLDALAVLRATRTTSLASGIDVLRRGAGDGLVVAVLGELTPTDLPGLAPLRQGATTGVAVVMDTPSWTPGRPAPVDDEEPASAPAGLLARAGWRVVPVSYGVALPSVWRLAGDGTTRFAETVEHTADGRVAGSAGSREVVA